jgi:hypothetical protein
VADRTILNSSDTFGGICKKQLCVVLNGLNANSFKGWKQLILALGIGLYIAGLAAERRLK